MKRLFFVVAVICAFLAPLISGSAASAETPLERGKYLMKGIVACGNCHTPNGPWELPARGKEMAGGHKWDEPPFTVYAANITPDKETGIGS